MPATHEQDLLVVHNPLNREFTVTWGGQPFTIPGNGEKVYPRFIAQHFAKHITDAAIFAREQEMAAQQGVAHLKHSLIGNAQIRSELQGRILPKIYQYYLDQPQQNEQERIAQKIEEASHAYAQQQSSPAPPEPAAAPTTFEGVDTFEKTPAAPTEPASSDVSLINPKKKKPTKAQLIADCEQLGVDLTGDESYEELVAKIKEFM